MGDLILPGDLMPGAVAVLERIAQTEQFTEGTAEATYTVSLDGDFDTVSDMTVIADADVSATSGGSASTEVDDVDVDRAGMTTDSMDVTVTLDSAPGAGETTDVVISALVSEGGD